MIRITAHLDSQLAELAGNHLPFAVSVAVNRTAVGARDVVRGNLPKRFRLRNQWTQRGVQVRAGNKSSPMALVVAPDYMAIQETGGTRTPERSHLLAAPADAVRSPSVIPRSKRPRGLMASGGFLLDMGDGEAGLFKRTSRRAPPRLMWWLGADQQYRPRFGFEDDVRQHVEARFATHFAAAVSGALAAGPR